MEWLDLFETVVVVGVQVAGFVEVWMLYSTVGRIEMSEFAEASTLHSVVGPL